MIANMPTEEVFTTPDNRVADGTVAATRPFQLIGGPTIEGLRLRFEGGRVVEVEAERNADAVRARLETDPGAVRLGEVALVDGTSPVGRTGRVFNDILFDENATCHIALGNGYGFTVPDLPADPDARAERGFNQSDVHQDLMIGGPEVDRRRARRRRQRNADPARRRLAARVAAAVRPRAARPMKVAPAPRAASR